MQGNNPPVKWKDRVLEYVGERNVRRLEMQGENVRTKISGGSTDVAIPLGEFL